MRREREIQLRENEFKANGSANPQERQQLRMALDGLRAEVERMMNNADVVRPPGYAGNRASTPGIDSSQFEINQRIEEGLRSG